MPTKRKNPCGPCTLCEFIQLPYAKQLKLKHEEFQSILHHLGAPIEPALPSPQKKHFRNKLLLPLKRKGNRLSMGFFKHGTHQIMEFVPCTTQDERLNKAALAVKSVLEKMPLNIYDEKRHSGLLRYLFLRSSAHTGDIQLAFVVTNPIYPGMKNVKNLLKEEFHRQGLRLSGFLLNINERKTNVILGNKEKVVFGSAKLKERILGVDFEVSVSSFLQTNPGMAEKMTEKTIEMLSLKESDSGLDLYCGMGSITLCLARKASLVTGIDNVQSSITDAAQNAKLNGLTNTRFHCTDLNQRLPLPTHPVDFVVMDPARQGCSEKVIQFLLHQKVRKVVYISCNPVSLRRDLALLKKGGYGIKSIQPVDMFPYTRHMESITLLEFAGRGNARGKGTAKVGRKRPPCK